MRIAIASGKGGTGKTTVAVNLALTAARAGQTVHLCDCDVEEPNAHLFLDPDFSRTWPVSDCKFTGAALNRAEASFSSMSRKYEKGDFFWAL